MRIAPSKSHQQRRPRRAIKRPPAILILRLDAEQLSRDGLTLGSETQFAGQIGMLCLRASVVTVNSATLDDLTRKLRALAEQRRRFDLIIVIGHSNESFIRHASDAICKWRVFAEFLKPFDPCQLALIACSAGGQLVTRDLFSALPTVDRIFASPECVNINLASLILAIAGYSLAGRRATAEALPMLKVIALIGTGGRLKAWQRHGAPSGQDVWEDILIWASRAPNSRYN